MKPSIMRVLIKGMMFSGSGAIVDLIKEYQSVFQVPGGPGRFAPAGNWELGEFNDFRSTGMVGEKISNSSSDESPDKLIKKAKRLQSSLNTKRKIFRSIKSGLSHGLEAIKEQWTDDTLAYNGSLSLKKLGLGLKKNCVLEDRIKLGQTWISELVSIYGNNGGKIALFDQPINFGQYEDIYPKVFDPLKLIIVHRSPFDQLAEMYQHGLIRNKWGGNFGYLYGWDLEGAFKFFIAGIHASMQAADQTMRTLGKEKVLCIRFEDLVQQYESTKTKVEEFLGFSPDMHIKPKAFFNPDWSKKNIGIYSKTGLPVDAKLLAPLVDWYNTH